MKFELLNTKDKRLFQSLGVDTSMFELDFTNDKQKEEKDYHIAQQKSQNLVNDIIPIHKGLIISNSLFNFLDGGRESGKSHSIARYILFKVLTSKEKGFVVCVRKAQSSLDESCKSLLEDIIADYDLNELFIIQKSSIRCVLNDVKIVFKGCKDARARIRLKSFAKSILVWFEEAQEFDEKDFGIILPTFTRYNCKMLFSYNRNVENDPVHIERIRSEKSFDMYYNFSTYLDNPYTSETTKIRANILKETSEFEYNHYYLGQVGGKYIAFPTLSLKNNGVEDDFDPTKENPWYMSMDWGRSDACCVGFYALMHDKTIVYKFHEIKVHFKTPAEIAQIILEIKQKYNPYTYQYAVADNQIFGENVNATGYSTAYYFQQAGVVFQPAYSKAREAGYLRFRHLIETKQLQVSTKCQYFWNSIPNLVMDEDCKIDIHQKGADDHCYDETRYMLMSIVLNNKVFNSQEEQSNIEHLLKT